MTDMSDYETSLDRPTVVWVLEPTGYDHYGILGVYESAEAAKWHWPNGTWRMDGRGDWVAGDEDLPMDQGGMRLYADIVRRRRADGTQTPLRGEVVNERLPDHGAGPDTR